MSDAALVYAPKGGSYAEDKSAKWGLSLVSFTHLRGWDTIGPNARVRGGKDLASVVHGGSSGGWAYTAYRAAMPIPTWEALMGRSFDCATCVTSAERCSSCPPPPWRVVARFMMDDDLRRSYYGYGRMLNLDLHPDPPPVVMEAITDLIAKRRQDTGAYASIQDSDRVCIPAGSN